MARGIRISDDEDGVLAFDLDDLLTVLRTTVDGLQWDVWDLCVEACWGEWAAAVVESGTYGTVQLTTAELRRLADSIGQTICGFFDGYDSAGELRVSILAERAESWAVWAIDDAPLARLERAFDEIEDYEPPVRPTDRARALEELRRTE